MRKSYELNAWSKTVTHHQVPGQLHISLPQHCWVVALQLWEPQGPEQRQLLLSRQEQSQELRLRAGSCSPQLGAGFVTERADKG